jgi:magnesium chelatase accessory protein
VTAEQSGAAPATLPSIDHRLEADGLRWHVVERGNGPCVLLIHGTAASTHSWREVMPHLAETYRVLAIDLPGHGGTEARTSDDYSLDRMSRGVASVLAQLQLSPEIVVGHSAGAAILVHACARNLMQPRHLVSFNGAFYPFAGWAGHLFSPIARLVAFNPLLPRILSGVATRATVERLLRDTGSIISPEGVEHYFSLFKQPDHVAAALGMMAAWDLHGMDDNLSRLKVASLFVAGDKDKAVPPTTADRAAARCRMAKALHVEGYGHLLHEENPALAAKIIKECRP